MGGAGCVVRDAGELLRSHPESPNRYRVLGLLFQADPDLSFSSRYDFSASRGRERTRLHQVSTEAQATLMKIVRVNAGGRYERSRFPDYETVAFNTDIIINF